MEPDETHIVRLANKEFMDLLNNSERNIPIFYFII